MKGWEQLCPTRRVIPLSLCVTDSGGIHKVLISNNQAFVIAVYRPFPPRAHVLGATLRPSTVSDRTSARHPPPRFYSDHCVSHRRSCTSTQTVNWSSWTWRAAPTTETSVRTACWPETLTAAGTGPTAPQSKPPHFLHSRPSSPLLLFRLTSTSGTRASTSCSSQTHRPASCCRGGCLHPHTLTVGVKFCG